MTPKELQKMICDQRSKYVPGMPMDAYVDQDILCGLVDGLGGAIPDGLNPKWDDGIRIGLKLREALK